MMRSTQGKMKKKPLRFNILKILFSLYFGNKHGTNEKKMLPCVTFAKDSACLTFLLRQPALRKSPELELARTGWCESLVGSRSLVIGEKEE